MISLYLNKRNKIVSHQGFLDIQQIGPSEFQPSLQTQHQVVAGWQAGFSLSKIGHCCMRLRDSEDTKEIEYSIKHPSEMEYLLLPSELIHQDEGMPEQQDI